MRLNDFTFNANDHNSRLPQIRHGLLLGTAMAFAQKGNEIRQEFALIAIIEQ